VRMRRPVLTPAHHRCLSIGRRFCEMRLPLALGFRDPSAPTRRSAPSSPRFPWALVKLSWVCYPTSDFLLKELKVDGKQIMNLYMKSMQHQIICICRACSGSRTRWPR
jgi:hypothetical protein